MPCIEMMPCNAHPICPVFGHSCPGGKKQVDIVPRMEETEMKKMTRSTGKYVKGDTRGWIICWVCGRRWYWVHL